MHGVWSELTANPRCNRSAGLRFGRHGDTSVKLCEILMSWRLKSALCVLLSFDARREHEGKLAKQLLAPVQICFL